jgi:hypothetical protein
MAANLITLQEYKSYVGITSTNQDVQINAIIPKVSQLVKTYCNRAFLDYVSEPKTEVFKGGTSYLLQEFPVLQILSLEYSNDYGNNYVELLEFTDWVFDNTTSEVFPIGQYSAFDTKPNSYRLTYFAGYETLPSDLKLAVLDLVTYYLRNDSAIHSTKAPGSNSVQIEYISTTNLPAHIKRVLDLYVNNYN